MKNDIVLDANDVVTDGNEIVFGENDDVSRLLDIVRDVFMIVFARNNAVRFKPRLGRITDGLVRK